MRRRTLPLTLGLFASALYVPATHAETTQHEGIKGYWSLQVENDLWASSDDRFYTNGVEISHVKFREPPETLKKMADAIPLYQHTPDKSAVKYSVGQKIFTPENTQTSALVQNDRPYAGWLFGSAELHSIIAEDESSRTSNALQFTVGIVGPSALAEQSQREVHKLIDSEISQGWQHQLKDEIGLNLTYTRRWQHFYDGPKGLEVELTPHVTGSVGNVYTYAGGGAMIRIGNDLRNDIGPPSITPASPGGGFFLPTKKTSFYGFAGVEGRAMAHNIFLDGNTFTDSHSVDKEHFVGDFQYGVAIQGKRYRVSLSNVLRSKEFKTQSDNGSSFGTINFTYLMN